MLTQKLYDYLLSASNYSYAIDDSMNQYNNSATSEGKQPNIRAKTLYRREPTLSYNVTLLIEFGIVVTVLTVVGLVFYFSHRNFKKRSNVHRRRWLESDVTIDNYSDGQIYDTSTTLAENQPQHIDLDPDDSPPPYESVVQQSTLPLKTKRRRHSGKQSKNCKAYTDALNRNLPACHVQFPHPANNNRNSEPLMSSQSLNCISTICNENSSLIERSHLASTSSKYEDGCNGLDDHKMNEKCDKREIKVNVDRLPKSQSARIADGKEVNEKLNTFPIKTAGCGNEIAVLDASGLPTYDTALKIQECGNM